MLRNVASQRWRVYAWDATTGLPKTGDAANITGIITKDDGTPASTNDTNPTEVDSTNEKGFYAFDLTQSESNAAKLTLACKSSTSNIVVMACPPVVYTIAQYASLAAIDSGGVVSSNLAKILATAITETSGGYLAAGFKKLLDVASPVFTLASVNQTGDSYAVVNSGTYGNSALKTLLDTITGYVDGVETDTATILSRIGSPASSLAADIAALNDISAADVWAAGSRTLTANTNLNDPTAGAIADAVWDEAQSGHTTAGTFGKYLDAAVSGVSTGGISASDIATAVWEDLVAGGDFGTTGSIGKLLVDNIDAAITSRLADADYTAPLDAAGIRTAVGLATANLDTQLSTISGYVDGVESDTATILSRIGSPASSLAADIAALNDITAADVWASVTRTLTSAANITSTGGTTVPQTGDSYARIGSTGSGLTTLATAASVAALNDVSTAQILTQIETALATTTRSLPGQATPSTTPTIAEAIMQLFQQHTNPMDQDSTTQRIYNRAGDTVHQKRTASTDGTTVTLGALVTGP